MIAAIYARKSTDQIGVVDEQKSVARQIEHAREYAARKGWTVVDEHIYTDDGVSGAEFENRPGFLRLMNALKPRAPFQVLVMSEESRLGREAIETAWAVKQIIQANVRIFFYLEERERTLDSPMDKMMLSLTTFADELEREKAAQRTKDAMSRKARAGHVTGGRVFGYKNVEIVGTEGRRSHVEHQIDSDEAAVIERIFTLCAWGKGLTAIAKTLNTEGAQAPRSQRCRPAGWTASSIREVLHRPLYKGERVWNRTKKRNRWGQKHQQQRPETEWMHVPMPHLRIVSDELWNAAHSRMAATRATFKGTWEKRAMAVERKYLLAGMAKCGSCGGSMIVVPRQHGKQRVLFYVCGTHHNKGNSICPNFLIVRMTVADAEAVEAYRTQLLAPAVTTRALEKLREHLSSRAGSGQPQVASIENRLNEIFDEQSRLAIAIARGGAMDVLLETVSRLESERRTLAAEKERLLARSKALGADPEELVAAAEARFQHWREALGQENSLTSQMLQKLTGGERITFTPDPENQKYVLSGPGTLDELLEPGVHSKSNESRWGRHTLWDD